MIVTLHMAVSIDGFVAGTDGNSDWVSAEDEKLFMARCRAAGAMAVGRKTFDQYKGKIYPVAEADNIVLSRRAQKDQAPVYYAATPRAAVEKAKSRGHSALLVSGGGQVSAAFLNDHLLDEIFLSVHPIILGQGIRLFAGASFNDGFKLHEVRALGEGLAQLHYKKKP